MFFSRKIITKKLASKMSRTFALEVQVSKNGAQLKKFSEDVVCTGAEKDVSTLLDVLHRTKECSNEFLTTLVEADKEVPIDIGGAVVSHSKRKHENGHLIWFAVCVNEIG